MVGRRKKPTKLKLLEGTLRKDRMNKNEANPENKIPDPPECLNQIASVEWGRLSTQLYNLGLLSEIDRAALAAYCEAYALWYEAATQYKDISLLTKTSNGNIIQNPLIGIINTARKAMLDAGGRFGLDPASRAKVTAKTDEKEADPWDKFG